MRASPAWADSLTRQLDWRDAGFWVRAPGRVNLIGEHTDYMGGLVLPTALDLEMRGLVRVRDDRQVRLRSLKLGAADCFQLGEENALSDPGFGRYARGVTAALSQHHRLERGFELVFDSQIPVAAGLSSSAALEALVGLAALAVNGLPLDRDRLVDACHWAENQFVGVACGLMDQTICIHGQAGNAVLIDCQSRARTLAPIGNMAIVVCNTLSSRQLSASAYNLRRSQCEQGLAGLARQDPTIRSLRDVDVAAAAELGTRLEPVIARRIGHVVAENQRVRAMVKALAAGDRSSMGRLCAASQDSLRDNFEVSSPELEAMVAAARGAPGLIGARLTGGGFGGCTVNLVEPARTADFAAAVEASYLRETGQEPEIYVCQSAAGASWGPV